MYHTLWLFGFLDGIDGAINSLTLLVCLFLVGKVIIPFAKIYGFRADIEGCCSRIKIKGHVVQNSTD
jgi:hypothetical protein